MEEKRNYVIYTNDDRLGIEEQERVIKMSRTQVGAIRWFMDTYGIEGCVELAEDYEGEEI